MLNGSEPAAAVEDQLTRIWRAVLHDDSLGRDSSYLDYGGTSLTALRLRAQIRETFGRDLEVIDIFEHPSPAAVCEVVRTAPVWHDDLDDE